MRNLEKVGTVERVLRWKTLTLNLDLRRARVNGAQLELRPAEFDILLLLLSRRNVALSKDAILEAVYAPQDRPDPRMIDVFVHRLRRKLAAAGLANAIASVWGRGYAVADWGDGDAGPEEPLTSGGAKLRLAAA